MLVYNEKVIRKQ